LTGVCDQISRKTITNQLFISFFKVNNGFCHLSEKGAIDFPQMYSSIDFTFLREKSKAEIICGWIGNLL
jgi:hypothetical protein